MATKTWTATHGNFKWETASNWSGGTVPQSGDDVILPSEGAAYTVTLATTTPTLNSLQIGNDAALNGATNAVTLILRSGAGLATTGAISIARYATIEGEGSINAGGGFNIPYAGSGTPRILAGTSNSGGVLDVTGTIAYGVSLGLANTSKATTLKLESANSLSSIAISSGTQTLEFGASANVTLSALETVAAGKIQLDGSTLTATNGVSLSSGATFTGTGTLAGNIYGSGSVISAAGGTRAVQFLIQTGHGEDEIEVESGAPACVFDVVAAGGPEQIVGERTQSSSDVRVLADA
jgi:hypothetical protein